MVGAYGGTTTLTVDADGNRVSEIATRVGTVSVVTWKTVPHRNATRTSTRQQFVYVGDFQAEGGEGAQHLIGATPAGETVFLVRNE